LDQKVIARARLRRDRGSHLSAQGAPEDLPDQEELLIGELRGGDHTEPGLCHRRHDGRDGLLPGRVTTAMTNLRQPPMIYPPQTIAPLITHPPLVDVRIVPGLQSQHPRALVEMRSVQYVVEIHIAPLRAAVAHRRGARKVPDPGLEAKILFCEGSHRADI